MFWNLLSRNLARRALALGLGLILAAGTAVSSASPASDPPGSAMPPSSLSIESSPTSPSESMCSTVIAQAKTMAPGTKGNLACFEESRSSGTGRLIPLAPFSHPEDKCAAAPSTNQWYNGREWFCFIDVGLTANTIQNGTGTLIGQVVYTVNHATGLDFATGTWTNYTSFYVTSEWGVPSNIVDDVNQCPLCSGINSADPMGGPTTAPLQLAVFGTNNLSDNPAPGAIDGNISVIWTDYYTCSGCTNLAAKVYTFPLAIRCDALVGMGYTQGCTIPSFTPTLFLSGYSTGNTSTAYVAYFQKQNVDHWGRYPDGKLLSRLNNPIQAQANRNVVCSGYQPNPNVTNDQCDEFPMASTYQSGNMLGLTASDCSEIVPQFNAVTGTWTFPVYPGYSTAQRCGRGHVVGTDNSSTGGQYRAFNTVNRVADLDQFWLQIVP